MRTFMALTVGPFVHFGAGSAQSFGIAAAVLAVLTVDELRIWRSQVAYPERSRAAKRYFEESSTLVGRSVALSAAALLLIGIAFLNQDWGGVLLGLVVLAIGVGITLSRRRGQRRLDAERGD